MELVAAARSGRTNDVRRLLDAEGCRVDDEGEAGGSPLTLEEVTDQIYPGLGPSLVAAAQAAVEAAEAAGATGNQEAAAPTAGAPTRDILSENVEHLSRGEGEADDTEAATGGTAQVATG